MDLHKQVFKLPQGISITTHIGGPADGKPVVLLHGGGTDHAMLSWRDTIPALLDAGYRVYAPDYPGYGESPPDENQPFTYEALIGYLTELMDAWEIDKAALVGISMGGGLSLGYALAHPDRVDRMALIGSYGIQDRAPYHAFSHFFVRMPWLVNASWGLARRYRWAAKSSIQNIIRNPASRTEALVDEVLEAMQNTHSQRAFNQWQQDEIQWGGVKTNYTDRLGEITAPVMLIHGTHDIGIPGYSMIRAFEDLPCAWLQTVNNAGHWTQRDYPDEVNKFLLDFLKYDDEDIAHQLELKARINQRRSQRGGSTPEDIEFEEMSLARRPCDMDQVIRMMFLGWFEKGHEPYRPWEEYFEEALARPECWTDTDMAMIYSQAGELYGYEDNFGKAADCYHKMHKLAEQDWWFTQHYINNMIRLGQFEQVKSIIGKLQSYDIKLAEEIRQRAELYEKYARHDPKYIQISEDEYHEALQAYRGWADTRQTKKDIHAGLRRLKKLRKAQS
jgi:pimeloyl-ACP methyl ester carboxylesterase